MAQTYTTQPGDTLSSIAESIYGQGSKWSILYDANRSVIPDPNQLEAGTTLTIPDPEQPATGRPSYVTAQGDSLQSVAERVYGDGEQWNVLYDANRNIIGDDPAALAPGITLLIPPLSTTGERSYTTVAGDTLWKIAERYYGDGIKWSVIYDINREAIGDDPNALAPDITLKIP